MISAPQLHQSGHCGHAAQPGMATRLAHLVPAFRYQYIMSELFEITDPPKDLRRGFYSATVLAFGPSADGKENEMEFDVFGVGPGKKQYAKKFTFETDEKKELEEIAGKSLRQAKSEDFRGKKVVTFVTLKRASGGRPLASIGPVMSFASFNEMAAAIK